MGFVIKHLRLVPHSLSKIQKQKRIEYSINLKEILKRAKHRGWRYILTGDESWFYLTIDHKQILTRSEAPPPTILNKITGSPKRIVTIFWSPLGFRVLRVLPKEVHFDAKYFRDNILSEIDRTRPTGSEEDDRRNLILHFDNAKPHTAPRISEYCREKK
jgi:hypothetical protein